MFTGTCISMSVMFAQKGDNPNIFMSELNFSGQVLTDSFNSGIQPFFVCLSKSEHLCSVPSKIWMFNIYNKIFDLNSMILPCAITHTFILKVLYITGLKKMQVSLCIPWLLLLLYTTQISSCCTYIYPLYIYIY